MKNAPIDHDFDLAEFLFELLAGFLLGAWLLGVLSGLWVVRVIITGM